MSSEHSSLSSDGKGADNQAAISTRIVHRYTVKGRSGEGIGKVAITSNSLEVYRLNKLRFLFLVGPFLGLITPIRKWMTNIRMSSFPLTSISVVENTSPRSYESMRINFSDGQSCEFRLSAMGKARLFEKMKGDIDRALELHAGRKLVETKPNVWEPQPIGRSTPNQKGSSGI